MSVGSRLRELMDRKAITAYELSKITGISQAALSRLFNDGTSKPNIKNAELLSKYFEVSREWLISGEEMPGSTNLNQPTMIDEARISRIETENKLMMDLIIEMRNEMKEVKLLLQKKIRRA